MNFYFIVFNTVVHMYTIFKSFHMFFMVLSFPCTYKLCWIFDHPYLLERTGQPKRHLLTTGWSLFVSGKRLFAGDSVIFVRYSCTSKLLNLCFEIFS